MLQVWGHVPSHGACITESLIWLGTENSLQYAFFTPQHPPSSSFAGDGFGVTPSSPIVQEGGSWDLDIEETHDRSHTGFVRACIDGPSSPTDSQDSDELPRAAHLRRMVSLQQGTDAPRIIRVHFSRSL